MDTYYNPADLARFGDMGKDAPELARKFFDYGAVFADGALTEREKSLIALAVAHAVQCPYCIDAYTRACLEKGSNLEEMTEAVHVATAIRGGAALVHGVQMRKVAAFLFGFLRSGATRMQSIAGVPIDIISIIQGLVIVFIAAPEIIRWLYRLKNIKVEETVLTRGWGS